MGNGIEKERKNHRLEAGRQNGFPETVSRSARLEPVVQGSSPVGDAVVDGKGGVMSRVWFENYSTVIERQICKWMVNPTPHTLPHGTGRALKSGSGSQ